MSLMAIGLVFVAPDRVERSVWVVVDPRDSVTGRRVVAPVDVRLKDVTTAPIAGLSGVYCFADLDLPAGLYVAQVEPRARDRAHYFAGETEFALQVIPVPGQPVKRNPVVVDLLPRPAYPFTGQTTLVRGRLLAASTNAALAGAHIVLILEGVDIGRRGRTDERGEFVVPFPAAVPADTSSAGLDDLAFRLRFEVDGQGPLLVPPLVDPEATVLESTTLSLGDLEFPGL
jgi:hypothetical protein